MKSKRKRWVCRNRKYLRINVYIIHLTPKLLSIWSLWVIYQYMVWMSPESTLVCRSSSLRRNCSQEPEVYGLYTNIWYECHLRVPWCVEAVLWGGTLPGTWSLWVIYQYMVWMSPVSTLVCRSSSLRRNAPRNLKYMGYIPIYGVNVTCEYLGV